MGQVVNARPHLNRNNGIPLKKKLLFTVWILSKPESFLACGDRFGIARSTAYYIFEEIVLALTEMIPQQIAWPDNHDASVAVNIFIQINRLMHIIYSCLICRFLKTVLVVFLVLSVQ